MFFNSKTSRTAFVYFMYCKSSYSLLGALKFIELTHCPALLSFAAWTLENFVTTYYRCILMNSVNMISKFFKCSHSDTHMTSFNSSFQIPGDIH